MELDLKCTEATLLDLDWSYDILDLDLENNSFNLLDSDWFYYKQAGLLLEKSENVLELPVKQLVIQLGLISSVSKGQTIFSVCKSKC